MAITDITRAALDPSVFTKTGDQDYKLRSAARGYILGGAFRWRFYGLINGVYIKGSILSFEWTPTVDIDVSIVLLPHDPQSLEAAQDEASALTEKEFLPGTRHPINYFIQEQFNVDRYDGVYNVIAGIMVKGPYSISVDPVAYMNQFRGFIEKIDLAKAELERDLVDYEALTAMPEEVLADLKDQVDAKIDEINADVKVLSSSFDVANRLRNISFADMFDPETLQGFTSAQVLPPNVIWKLLERYHYAKLMWAVRKVAREVEGRIQEPEDIKKLALAVGV